MSLGIYRDALADEVAYLVTYADVAVIFAEDEEQVDKLLQLEDRIPTVRHIVYSDPRGLRKYDDPRLISLAALEEKGAALHGANPGRYGEMVAAGTGADVAILCTTSGTTSHPKLAMLTAGALLKPLRRLSGGGPARPGRRICQRAPDAVDHGADLRLRSGAHLPHEGQLRGGAGDDHGRHARDRPLLRAVRAARVGADRRRRAGTHDGRLRLQADHVRVRHEAGTAGAGRGPPLLACRCRAVRALRDRLGFTNLKSAATGGAALGPDTFRFFLALGVPMRQLYGQTELLGAYTIHTEKDVDFDTVGVPMDGVELRIDDPDPNGLGEIVTRHRNIFLGYYRNEEETKKSFEADGWMKTGDAGFINAKGHLVVIDRVRDMASTAHGDRFSPQYIENKLKFSPYVAEAVILGDGRDHLAAMICIRFPIVAKWAEKNRIAFTTYTDLSAKPEVIALLRREVEQVNRTLAEKQRIAKFLLLYKELDADDGELTRTRKVRRGVINERYGTIIDAMYRGDPKIDVDTTITFQDGTKQRIKTVLDVVKLDTGTAPAAGNRRAA